MSEANDIGKIRTAVDEGVLIVTLSRPAKKNAFTNAMYAAFADALERLATDPALRCLLVAGEGGCFSAGNDLNDFLALERFDDETPVVRVLHALARGTKPMLAAVDGPAVGIGTTLLLHCDLVWCTPASRFAAPFVPLGLVPEAASSRLLVEQIGYRRAMAMFLLGETLDATRAEALGLVNGQLPGDDLLSTVLATAHRVAALPPVAVEATRALCRAAPDGIGATIERENVHFAERLADEGTRAAIAAALQARRRD